MTTPTTDRPRRQVYKTAKRPITDDPPRDDPPVPPTSAPSVSPERAGPIARWVTEKYQWIGRLLAPIDPVCGKSIYLAAESAGMAWQRMARQNKNVKALIERLMQSTAASELFFAHLPIFLAVASHHVPEFRDFIAKSSLSMMANFPLPDVEESAA